MTQTRKALFLPPSLAISIAGRAVRAAGIGRGRAWQGRGVVPSWPGVLGLGTEPTATCPAPRNFAVAVTT
jgi:hypothetical protein